MFDWQQDFFLVYPPYTQVLNVDSNYHLLSQFYRENKAVQRNYLSVTHSLPVPETYVYPATNVAPGQWIVRPLRHSGGRHYRITEDITDFIENHEYIQRVFPKTAEYRIVFVKGQMTLLMKKRNQTEIPPEQPWNHANGSSFYTIQDVHTSKLMTRSDCITRLSSLPIITLSHLVAVDVLWHDTLGYVVAEFNTCPGLSIETNLERVCNVILPATVLES